MTTRHRAGLGCIALLSVAVVWAADEDLPWAYVGDGMVLVIDAVGDTVEGTLSINDGAPHRYVLPVPDDSGRPVAGNVRMGDQSLPLEVVEIDDSTSIALFQGRRYRLVDVDPVPYLQQRRQHMAQALAAPASPGSPALAASTSPPQPAPKPPPVNVQSTATLVLKQHSLADTHTLLAPKGWRVEGGAWYPPQQYPMWFPSRRIRLSGPEGSEIRFEPNLQAVDTRPVYAATPQPGTPEKGQIVLPMPRNLEEWARFIADDIRREYPQAKDVRIVKTEIAQAHTQRLRGAYRALTQQIMQTGGGADQVVIVVEATYSEGGRDYEQSHIFAHTYQSMSGQYIGYWAGWTMEDIMVLKAPVGGLQRDEARNAAVLNSLRRTPEWERSRNQLIGQLNNINAQVTQNAISESKKRTDIIYQSGQEISGIIAQHPIGGSDAGHSNAVDAIHDMQSYQDPGSGSVVSLPDGYDNVYSNGQGEYVLTTDQFFNPNSLDGNWQRIEKARQ